LKLRNTLGLHVGKPTHSYSTLPLPVNLADKDIHVRALGEEGFGTLASCASRPVQTGRPPAL